MIRPVSACGTQKIWAGGGWQQERTNSTAAMEEEGGKSGTEEVCKVNL